MKKKVTIHTDGSCSGNPGPGGWAAILRYGSREKVISGREDDTTNNRMELSAVIHAVAALKEPCEIHLFTDSKYVECIVSARNWREQGWVSYSGKPVLNQDLWEELLNKLDKGSHVVRVHRIARMEDEDACRTDAIAKSQARGML
jgi:ribonuclease HI